MFADSQKTDTPAREHHRIGKNLLLQVDMIRRRRRRLARSNVAQRKSSWPRYHGQNGARFDITKSAGIDITGSLSNHAGAPRMNGWPPTAGFYTPGGSSVSGGSSGASTRVKLPKIELKSFTGKAIDWFPFWEHFSSLVDANPDLSLVDKLAYLKSVLKGDASLALDGLALTGDNYIIAIEILRERYGDSQRVISEHMEALFNLEAVTSAKSTNRLRKLLGSVEVHVRSLENLGRPPEQYGDMFIPLLFTKLPSDIRLAICEKVPPDQHGLRAILSQLQAEVSSRERAEYLAVTVGGTKSDQTSSRRSPQPATASALTVSSTTESSACVYCSQAHESRSCTVVTNVKRRKEILRRDGRCYVCLKQHHISRNCKSKVKCAKCQQRHHTTICESSENKASTNTNSSSSESSGTSATAAHTVVTDTTAPRATLLQTAKVTARSSSAQTPSTTVRVILDGGSQRSYVAQHVCDKLSLSTVCREQLTVNAFGGKGNQLSSYNVVEVSLVLNDGSLLTVRAVCMPFICAPVQEQFPLKAIQQYDHLQGLALADDCAGGADIDMLLGADVYWQIVTGDIVRGPLGPVAVATKFGWVLSGPSSHVREANSTSVSMVSACSTHVLACSLSDPTDSLLCQLQQFWKIESLGILSAGPSVLELFQQTIRHDGERYTVNLPWREGHRALPDNYQLCQRRLQSTLKRLRNNPAVQKEYDSVIQDQIARGIVEKVESTEGDIAGEVHYLPHHPVIRQDKLTTKVRVVYDASAKVGKAPSLNECLHAGPSLIEHITDILLRFRIHRVALIGDIEKAFLMVGINESDRDVLRFLWVDDVSANDPKTVVLRFTRVVFGVSSSPFLLNATLQHHLSQYQERDPQFVKLLHDSLYVDDIVTGGPNEEAVYELYLKIKIRLAEGGFNARKFASSSPALMEEIKKKENREESASVHEASGSVSSDGDSYAKSTLNSASVSPDKVLGIPWNMQRDVLIMDLAKLFQDIPGKVTKRQVLAASSRVYDPLGFVSPVTVTLKIFFQELCELKIGWDDVLDDKLQDRWSTMVDELRRMEPVILPRCYFTDASDVQSVVINGFSDASCKAFAAVVYLVVYTREHVHVQLVASRSRVAPLAKQTIPRLELMSSLILARLIKSVLDAFGDTLPVSDVRCWSDSQVALYWITGVSHEWKQFVQNRVNEIRLLVEPSLWRYCPTQSNPADLPSRGVKPAKLSSTIWFSGPNWLRDQSSEQPQSEDSAVCGPSLPPDASEELKSTRPKQVAALLAVSAPKHCQTIGSIVDVDRFSSVTRTLRVTALVLKFVERLRKRVKSMLLTAEDMQRAKILWLLDVQRTLAADPKFDDWCREFGVFADEDGILRCGGRLQMADIPSSQKHPIILHHSHGFTKLLVLLSHYKVQHNGVKDTLTEVRASYWIVRGRQVVRKLIRDCQVCRRYEGAPYQAEAAPPLPEFRTSVDYPFSFTGVDFAGPLYVKEGTESKKVYIALYTCGVSRAVHLDLVPDLSAEAFLRSFKRFTARFGVPREMKSDNAKTFQSASKTLSALFDLPEVSRYMSGQGVCWSFNLEKAPWWGGFFERMVRCVKRCLKKTIHQSLLSYEELLTVLLEVEAVLNSRPLTYVSADDLDEPLTPSHLIYGKRILSCPEPEDVDLEHIGQNDLLRRFTHLKIVVDHFWARWSKEYLLELRNAHRMFHPKRRGVYVGVGDVVVIGEDGVQRGLWKLGLVVELLKGSDGKVRGAVVKTSTPKGKVTELRRPLQRLYPVEVGDSVSSSVQSSVVPDAAFVSDTTPQPDAVVLDDPPRSRPQRAAARAADVRRRQLTEAGAL